METTTEEPTTDEAPEAPPPEETVVDEKMSEKEELKKEVLNDGEETLDKLELLDEPTTWQLTYDGQTKDYVQEPLTFMSKMELFALIGDTAEIALAQGGEDIIANMMMPSMDAEGNPVRSAMDAREFMSVAAKLLRHSPTFLADVYCLALNVPHADRNFARMAMQSLDDDDGFRIMEVFLDQNAAAIEDFIVARFAKVAKRAKQRFVRFRKAMEGREDGTPAAGRSRRSKRIAQDTAKQ